MRRTEKKKMRRYYYYYSKTLANRSAWNGNVGQHVYSGKRTTLSQTSLVIATQKSNKSNKQGNNRLASIGGSIMRLLEN
jgi:hypothetical protein